LGDRKSAETSRRVAQAAGTGTGLLGGFRSGSTSAGYGSQLRLQVAVATIVVAVSSAGIKVIWDFRKPKLAAQNESEMAMTHN